MHFEPLFTGLPRMRAVFALLVITLFMPGCAKHKKISTPLSVKPGQKQNGIASWYGVPYHGRRAANGEVYDMHLMTAAHRTWPFDTLVQVTNLTNQRTVDVRITDRGPFVKGRIIDLSRAAAEEIAMIGPGTAKVELRVIATGVRVTPNAPKKASAAPAPVAAVKTERFGVQVAALSNQQAAEALRVKLESECGVARVVARQGQRTLWRVIAGEAATEEEAGEIAVRLRERHPQCMVVHIDE